jgi:hypothetical protein
VASDVREIVDRFLHPVRGGQGRSRWEVGQDRFLHPVLDGLRGNGWEVGQSAFISDLFNFISLPERVGFISSIALEPLVPLYHDPASGGWNDQLERPFTLALGTPRAVVRLVDYELVCSAIGSHNITATVVT